MNGETQDGPERNSRGAVWVWLCWLAGILVLYVLSSGPVWMMVDKKLLHFGTLGWRAVQVVYWPLGWAGDRTLLRKPLEMYWHLWAPGVFDSKGNMKSHKGNMK
jgi:hypothetical protein